MGAEVPFLVADQLTRAYGATLALDRVDLAAARGSVLAVLGPNGCGKTTTVRIFATLLRADSGRALVGGHDVVTEAAAVRAMIGLAGQYAAVDPFLTGRENLELVGELRHLPAGQCRRDAGRLLERLGLSGAAGRLVRTYSGGMRRRVDLAAALIGDPPALFLDEPTTGLDPRSRRELWDLIGEQAAGGDHRVADNPVHGGSRPAGWPDRRAGPRPGDRHRQPTAAESQGGRGSSGADRARPRQREAARALLAARAEPPGTSRSRSSVSRLRLAVRCPSRWSPNSLAAVCG